LFEWLSQRIERILMEHASMGTTTTQVADFEDFHRRLEHELNSREAELHDIKAEIDRVSPSSEKASLELRWNELSTRWNCCRQTIHLRLGLAGKFLSVLRRVRDDEHQQNLISERMHQLYAMSPTTLSEFAKERLTVGPIDVEGPDTLRTEVTLVISRIEDQQTLLRDYIDQVTQRADRDFNAAEPIRFCQQQTQLNARQLERLRESWVNCERFWEQWKMAREYWLRFSQEARQLDEMLVTSLSQMSRASLPSKPSECDIDMRNHQQERERIDSLTSSVRAKVHQLGSLIGARLGDAMDEGRGWRLIEVPTGPEDGLPASSLGKRVRSELVMQLAGLETRWSAWDRAWSTRRFQLERRGEQVGRLATIEEVEGEIAMAEGELRTISMAVSLDAPIEQVERAELELNQLEATIPVLQTRVRSTAPAIRMQLFHGEPDELGTSELPIDLTDRQQQLLTRFDRLMTDTSRCRVEVSLTLRLLRAIAVADNAVSQLTFSLTAAKDRLRKVPQEDRVSLQTMRSEIEEQYIRTQALADMHIPTLEQLAAQHPQATEAKRRIEPTVSQFRNAVDDFQRLTEEVRVRSEKSLYLTRPVGVPVASEMTTSQYISAPFRPMPPHIVKPLRNTFTEEGVPVVLMTEFSSGLPPDADLTDSSQLGV
ncbi:unnamed protein product, partial [Dicrocoelium dendriticum]